MPRAKIQRSSRPGKTWMVKVKNPKTGREKTIHGGQKGAKVRPGTAKMKSFLARHGKPKTAKQLINQKIWKGTAKIGSTVNIPKEYL